MEFQFSENIYGRIINLSEAGKDTILLMALLTEKQNACSILLRFSGDGIWPNNRSAKSRTLGLLQLEVLGQDALAFTLQIVDLVAPAP